MPLKKLFSEADGKVIQKINLHNHTGDYMGFSMTANTPNGGKATYHKFGCVTVAELEYKLIKAVNDAKKCYNTKVEEKKSRKIEKPKATEEIDGADLL